MSSGLASVVTDIPANRQLVSDGVHGLLVGFDQHGEIAGALLRLIRDGELRGSLGRVAREKVKERFSTAQIVARYEELFAEIRKAG